MSRLLAATTFEWIRFTNKWGALGESELDRTCACAMDELMQTAGRYIGRFWTDISGARDPEEVADVARALVFTPLKAGLKRARDAISSLEVSTSPGGLGHERTANDAGVVERRKVRVARRAPVSGGDVGRASRFAAEAADAERASTAPAEHDTPAEPEPSPSAGRQKRRRVDADDAPSAEDAPPAPASTSPKHPPANLRVRTALGDKTPAGILKENGRPTKRKRRDRPVTTRHHVTFEDEVGNEDVLDDDDESPARARRRVDPGAESAHGGPSSTAPVSLPIRKPLAVILPEPPTLPSRAGRVSLRPHGRLSRHPASHHLRASRGVGRTGAGVLASVARPRAIGGWNAGGTWSKPAELVDLPADPKPLGAVGGADTAVPGLPGGLTGFAVPPVATGDGSGAAFTFGGGGGGGGGMKRSKSKKGKGDGDEGLFAGLADFKKTDGDVETPSGGTAKVEADKAAGGDGDKPAAATFSFGAPSLSTGDKKDDKKDDEVKAPAPAFSFGAPAVGDKADGGDGEEKKEKEKEEKDAAPAFTFGAPAAGSSAAAASATSTPAFTFGASAAGTPAPASAAAPGSTFTFGAPAATAVSAPPSAPPSAPSSAPAFSFGAAPSVPSASAASSGAAPSFSFGAAAPVAAGGSIAAPASTPATTFTFGAAAASVAAAAAPIAAAPFSFGAPAAAPAANVVTLSSGGAVPAPSFSFGGAPPPAAADGGMAMGGGGTPGGRRKVRARRPPR